MKTIELRDSFGIDSLVLGDRPKPTPGAGEVLLKVKRHTPQPDRRLC